MFYDIATITVKAGDGGDGMISFRREKYVPHGGPSGGDGGRGGDIVLAVNSQLNTLITFQRKRHFVAPNGVNGGSSNKTGANGEPLFIPVPPGTLVKDSETGKILADLVEVGQNAVVAVGGRGGRGNARFATATNQAPRVAERGEPGEDRTIELELKLIADVGIIGVPNAGKSTLLAAISAAKPKIADYPFTTLSPNLGVVKLDDYSSLVIADIPGLIEGAHAGVGLGHDFLRHIERTRVLIHLLDGAGDNPISDWAQINQELALYNPELSTRPQLMVLNKMDLEEASLLWWPEVQKLASDHSYDALAISAVSGQGLKDLLYRVKGMVDQLPPAAPTPVDEQEPLIDEDAFTISKEVAEEGKAWRISGVKIERLAVMTYWEFSEARDRFQRAMDAMGIIDAMIEAGVQRGDTVIIGDEKLEWSE
ncbi:MAG: GTPase ObgE [Chloroflexota bacterium]